MTQSVDNAWVASLLQVSDPLFPTGGYAHSLGFEQWASEKNYKSKEDLNTFFLSHGGPALKRLEFPYLIQLLKAFKNEDFEKIIYLDSEINAWKWASEIRLASIAQGRGRVRLLKLMWEEDPLLENYHKLYNEGGEGTHLAVCALQYNSFCTSFNLFAYGYQPWQPCLHQLGPSVRPFQTLNFQHLKVYGFRKFL